MSLFDPLLRVAALAIAIAVVALMPAGSQARYATASTEHLARVCTAADGAAPAALSRYCISRGW